MPKRNESKEYDPIKHHLEKLERLDQNITEVMAYFQRNDKKPGIKEAIDIYVRTLRKTNFNKYAEIAAALAVRDYQKTLGI